MNQTTAIDPASALPASKGMLVGPSGTLSDAFSSDLFQLFYSAFSGMEEGFVFADKSFRLLYSNPAAHGILKKAYNREIAVGEYIPGCLPEGKRPLLAAFFTKVLTGKTIECESLLQGEGGAIVWVGGRYFPTKDAQGAITGICVRIKDITAEKELEKAEAERKEMEQRLLQEKSLFEGFMKNNPLRAWITDEEGTIHYFNPAFGKEFGLGPDAQKINLFELFPEDLAWKYHHQNREVIRTGSPVVVDSTSIMPGGAEQVVKVVRFPLTFDGRRMVGGYTVDITEHIRLQEQLAKSLEQYEYVTRATSDAIYEWDLETGNMHHSGYFEELFGRQQVPMLYFEGIHPADRNGVLQLVTTTLNDPGKDRWQVDYRHRAGDGHYRHVACKSFVIRREGKAVRVIGAMQDITEQKALQEKLIEQEKGIKREIVRSIIETQEKERRQVSVELHDNISQVVASCKLMLEVALANPAKAIQFTEKAYTSLQEIINGLRRISHNLNPSTIADIGLKDALGQLLEKTAASTRLNINFHHCEFEEAQLAQPEDKTAVYRIIEEQVANIVQHARAREVCVRLSSGPAKVFVSVQDDGTGFDEKSVVAGRGLRSIYHRVAYYNGKMLFATGQGRGCTLKVLLHTAAK